jgi:hypothetical protein
MMNRAAYTPVTVVEHDPLDLPFSGDEEDRGASTQRLRDYNYQEELRCPPLTFQQQIPQARHLTWTDSFYDGKHGIIAAFDRDMEKAGNAFAKRYLRSAALFVALSITYWILGVFDYQYSADASVMDDIMGVYTLGFACLFVVIAWRAKQAMLTQHVAVTTEGVRIDNGSMLTVTIPMEHIQKMEVKTNQFCWTVDPTLFIVTIHRETAPLEQFCCQKTRKMELIGILRAHEFVDLVMELKDVQVQGSYLGGGEGDESTSIGRMATATTTSNRTASAVELPTMNPGIVAAHVHSI